MMPVKLRQLNPMWVPVAYDFSSACGLLFQCPLVSCKHSETAGAHYIKVMWQNVPGFKAEPNLWELASEVNFDQLTIKPSILADRHGFCKFHGYITNGEVTW